MTVPERTRPTTVVGLQAAAMRAFSALETAIDGIPEAERGAPFRSGGAEASTESSTPPRDGDLQDVLNHLHAWHVLLLGWLDAVADDRVPAYPAEGRSWSELDQLNHELRDKYRARDVEQAHSRLRTSHAGVLARVGALDESMLFDDARFAWLNGAALAEPVHECLGGHYEWAIGVIEARS